MFSLCYGELKATLTKFKAVSATVVGEKANMHFKGAPSKDLQKHNKPLLLLLVSNAQWSYFSNIVSNLKPH